jgi:hypothetical protein
MQYKLRLYIFADRHATNFFTENFIRFLENEAYYYLLRFIIIPIIVTHQNCIHYVERTKFYVVYLFLLNLQLILV